jgi:hypothetical protein
MAKGCTLSKVSVPGDIDIAAWLRAQQSTTLPEALPHNSHSTAPPHSMISKALSSKSSRNPSSRVSIRDSSSRDASLPRSLPGAQARRDVLPLSVEPRRVAPRRQQLSDAEIAERLEAGGRNLKAACEAYNASLDRFNDPSCTMRKNFHATTYIALVRRELDAKDEMIVACQNELDLILQSCGY